MVLLVRKKSAITAIKILFYEQQTNLNNVNEILNSGNCGAGIRKSATTDDIHSLF